MPKKAARKGQGPLQMSDLAKIAGVSESTVSRALADHPSVAQATRVRIKALASELGYRINPIARSLRAGRSGVIAVVVPLQHDRNGHLTDPFMMTMLTYLADELTSRGYSMLLSKAVQESGAWLDSTLAQSIAEGLVIIGQSHEHEAINAAAERGAPLVAWGAQMPGQAYPCVGSDNHAGGLIATRHLIRQGRRRIAFLGDERLPVLFGLEELCGFRGDLGFLFGDGGLEGRGKGHHRIGILLHACSHLLDRLGGAFDRAKPHRDPAGVEIGLGGYVIGRSAEKTLPRIVEVLKR